MKNIRLFAFSLVASIGLSTALYGGDMYVKSGNTGASSPYDSWATAAANIADAVAIAADGTTIHVAPGLYQSPSPIVVTNAIRVLGDDPDPSRTVVSNVGQINYYGSHNQRLFTIDNADALVANLTMQKGIAYYDISGGDFFIGTAGGTVSNCVVEAGDANSNGHAGGGYMEGGLVTHTIFRRNTCNSGSANWSTSRPGVLLLKNSSRAENCLFDNNSQTKNVVLMRLDDTSVMRNCTIVNTRLSVTNADCASWSALQIATGATAQNVVIAGVTNAVDGAPCPPTWTKSRFLNGAFDGDVTGLPTGTITGTAAKFFKKYDKGDYRPKAPGPLVNKGVSYEGMAAKDLGGNKRLIGRAVDIGCYEANAAELCIRLR